MNSKIKKLVVGDFSLMRFVRSVVSGLIILYVFLLFYGCFYGDKAMFPAPRPSYSDTPETKSLRLADGTKITIYEAKVPNPEFYILYSHGNAVDLGIMEPFMKRTAEELNCSVIGYDYPGYGTSEGSPTEKSIYASIEAVYQYLKAKGIKDQQIVIWGRSVGGGPATYIAKKQPVSGLILESAFTSAFRVVTRIQILPFDRFPNIDRIAEIECPVLFIHGRSDRVIPFHHGETLYSKAKDPKYFLWLDKAGHNDVEWVGGEKYWLAVKDFIKTLRTSNIEHPTSQVE